MPIKFASAVSASLKAEAVKREGSNVYTKFNGNQYGATKFARRTQYYINGMTVSLAEMDLSLCTSYRQVFGDKPSEDVDPGQLVYVSAPHAPVTRGQKDYAKANPDALRPTITTIEEFKTCAPGTYNVAGEASGYLSRMQVMQYLDERSRVRHVNAQTRHRRRLVRKAQDYSHAIMSEMFAITRRYGCAVRISGAKVTIEDKPKNPTVVKKLDKLARLYTATYGTRGTMDKLITHLGTRS